MFDPCVIPKHQKQKVPDAETGENKSFPRQLQRGVEHVLRRCESSSAEQPTVYTRLAAMTQVFQRSRKKRLTRKHWSLKHAKTTVNREQCPSKNSPLNYVRPMCYSQTSEAKKRQIQRQERTGHLHVNSKEEWNMFYDGVNHRVQSNRQFTQDLRQWHKSSIEAEKNISQGSIGPYNTPKQLWAGKNQAKISPFNYVRPMCYSQTSEAKNARFRDRREQVIYTSTPKRSGTYSTMV